LLKQIVSFGFKQLNVIKIISEASYGPCEHAYLWFYLKYSWDFSVNVAATTSEFKLGFCISWFRHRGEKWLTIEIDVHMKFTTIGRSDKPGLAW